MELLKKYFPHAFKAQDVASLIVTILIYLAIGLVGGLIIALANALTGWIPVLGTLVGIVCGVAGTAVDIYATAGIVIAVLVMCKVLK